MDPKMAWKHFELGEKHYRHLKSVKERLTVMAYQNMMCRYDNLDVEQIDSKLIWMLSGQPRSPRSLPFYKHITRTHVTDELPKFYEQIDVESLLTYVKPILIDRILAAEHDEKNEIPLDEMFDKGEFKVASLIEQKQLRLDQQRTTHVVTKMIRTIVNVLAEHKPYLRKALVRSTEQIFRRRWIMRFRSDPMCPLKRGGVRIWMVKSTIERNGITTRIPRAFSFVTKPLFKWNPIDPCEV